MKLYCNPLHQILCEGITYSNWPWGTQMCNLSFGSWSYDSSDFILHFYDDMVSEQHFVLRQIMTLEGENGSEAVW